MSAPAKVPAPILARVEHTLATRNVGGKVPRDIFCQILDDMAEAGARVAQWSCQRLYEQGLHGVCRRTIHTHHGRAA